MQASRRAKRKEAAGESSGRDPSSLSLSLAFSDIEERIAKKYHTKCQIEKTCHSRRCEASSGCKDKEWWPNA